MVFSETYRVAIIFFVAMVTAEFNGAVFVEETARVGDRLLKMSFRFNNNTQQVLEYCNVIGKYEHMFLCDISGVLYLKQKLSYGEQNSYNITVSYGNVKTETRFTTNVLLNVLKAQAAPVLHIKAISIDEELPIGTDIGKPFEIGQDGDSKGFTYTLKGQGSKYLSVNYTTGYLSILERIDRDVFNDTIALNVGIIVKDADQNVYTAPLNITVLDINDNAPVFSLEMITLNIDENSQGALHNFVVHDLDIGNNAEIKLNILEENSTFIIRGITLFGTRPLDYETKSEYELIVMAVDLPEKETEKTGRTTVKIKCSTTGSTKAVLNPVNEFSPVWEEPIKGDSGSRATVQLPEIKTGQTIVTRLYASDNDSGLDGFVSYSVVEVTTDTGMKADGMFNISNNQLILTSVAQPHDTVLYYDVVINAKDGGRPSKSTIGVIRVEVRTKSTNLHDPVWMSPPLNDNNRAVVTIDRDTTTPTTIATIKAVDNDSGGDGILEYIISNITANTGVKVKYTFILEATKGELTLVSNLARSQVKYYDLDILVRDMGIPPRSITRTLRVNIKPKTHLMWLSPMVGGTGSKATLTLTKKTQVWTVVTTLNATRWTSRTENNIIYTIVSTKTDQGRVLNSPAFLVQPEGEIRTIQLFLDDEVSYYDLEVEATFVTNKMEKIQGTIRIMLESNVTKPTLAWTSPMTANVSENTPLGTTISTIVATPPSDVTEGQHIIYSLLSSYSNKGEDASGKFSLDSATGNVILNSVLDRELLSGASPYFSLQVQATVEHFLKPKTQITGTLNVFVMDENEFPPSFNKSFYKQEVNCDIAIGYNVLDLDLNDNDATANFNLQLQYPSQYVDVTTHNDVGSLVLRNRPTTPSEEPVNHLLRLILSDGGVPERTTKTIVLVSIHWCSENLTISATTTADDVTDDGVTVDDEEFNDTSLGQETSSEAYQITSVSYPNFSSMTSSSTPFIIYQEVVEETGAWVVRALCIVLFLGYVFLVAFFITKRLTKPLGRVDPQINQTENNNPTEYPSAPDASSQNVVPPNYQEEPPSDPMILPPYGGNTNYMDHISHGPMTPVPPVMPAAPLAPPTMATTGHTLSGNLTSTPSMLTEPIQAMPPLCTASQAPPRYLPPINPDPAPKPAET